ncbi:MAG: hypothetical protein ACFFA0_06050 [Promethearchaeota archaeon]
MNEVVFFSLIIMLCIRIIGFGVSVNFFYDYRKKLFFNFIFGWVFGIIGNVFPLILDFMEDSIILEFILVLNALLVSLSMILIMDGFLSYYLKEHYLYLTLICAIITIIAILLFIFLGYNISISFSVMILNSLVLITFIFPMIKLKFFKEILGEGIRWYYISIIYMVGFVPVSIFIYLKGYGYGLYNSDDLLLIVLNYGFAIVFLILIVLLHIHNEYTMSYKQKNQLKDKFSHNLGNIMQVIYSSVDLIKRISKIENNENDKLDLIEKKCKEASNLINEIRDL